MRQGLEGLGMAGLVLRECLRLYLGVLRGRQSLDLKTLAEEVRDVGLVPLPVVTLVAAAVGLIVGIQAEQVLAQADLPAVLIEALGIAVVRELAPLLVGIFVAGRAGVALAVRIGSMGMSRELDGLIVSGVNPIQFTVGSSLVAMLAMSFALLVWAALTILTTTAVYLWHNAGVPLAEFREDLLRGLAAGDLLVGIAKPLCFALLVALIAAVNGSRAPRQSAGVSHAATHTMMGALAAIIFTDLLFVYFGAG